MYRSRDAHLAGVCAGIADYFELDPIVVRILAVLIALTTLGLGVIVYLALWAALPRAPESPALYEVVPEKAESSAFGRLDSMQVMRTGGSKAMSGPSFVARLSVAVALMLLFMAVAVNVSPMVSGVSWWQFWPLALLMAGLFLIVVPVGAPHESFWHAVGIAVTSIGASMLPMSLGVIAWETVPYAIEQLWVFLVVSAAMFVLGYSRGVGALMIAGALCFSAFCLIMLTSYFIPGNMDGITLLMPDGRSLLIVMSPG